MRRFATLGIALILLLVSDLRAQEPSGPTADNPPPAAQQPPPVGQTVSAPTSSEPQRAHKYVQLMHVDRSPVSSVFGFYVGGQKGPTVSVATSFYF
jgi:hypothetical protein